MAREHDRGDRQADRHRRDGQDEGLPLGAFGPLVAPLGPDHALGPAALVPAPRVPVQLGQEAAVHFGGNPLVELGRDPLVDVSANPFHQPLGQGLVIAGAEVLQGAHRGGDLSLAVYGHHVLRTCRQLLRQRYGSQARRRNAVSLRPLRVFSLPEYRAARRPVPVVPGACSTASRCVPQARICWGASGKRGYHTAVAAASAGERRGRPGLRDAVAVVRPNESRQRRWA